MSIITVCFNAGSSIKKTIESVIGQTFDQFEYLIKDGGSTDETLSIAESYAERFRARGIPFRINSEKDQGIYDAMNTAVRLSEGTWINFMNAGDCYYSADTLSDIFKKSNYVNDGILYGDAVECEYGHYYKFRKSLKAIESRMPFSHQSAFVNRELLIRYPFKTDYRIGADYDFLLSMHEKGYHFKDTGVIVCIVEKGGVSSLRLYDTFMESVKIREAHGIPSPPERKLRRILWGKAVKQYVLDHFPDGIKKQIRKVQWAIRGQNFEAVLPAWESEPDKDV
ncbi:MAG: glycosyltransferase [Lachnospiraceae bacterium]|nr:glycosyltransferase [Lachnospiraceae bacterium]